MQRIIAIPLFLLLSAQALCEQQLSRLQADGPDIGKTAYQLIREFGGPRSIESPDLYPLNHPETPHIYEASDKQVGHHFVFILHRDLDKDRDKYKKFFDRQRNEIKAYAGSKNSLKGFEGERMRYTWKFKLDPNMSLSKNFSHFFQLKSVDDGVGMPIFTISGVTYKDKKWLGISHAAVQKSSILARVDWEGLAGEWLQADVTVDYADNGTLKVNLSRHSDGESVLSYEAKDIDMWRGTKKNHFVRPKWGFYRSLKSKHMLINEQDHIKFADFEVIKF